MSVTTLISDSKPKTAAYSQKPEGETDFASAENYELQNSDRKLKVRWIESTEELESLKSQWDELANHSVHRNPTFESNFLLPALQNLADSKVRVLIAEFDQAEDNKLLALIPFRSTKVFGLPFKALEIWKHELSFDSTPLIRSELASSIWAKVIQFLQNENYAFLGMEMVSAEAKFESLITNLEKQLQLSVFRKNLISRAAIRPTGSAEDYKRNHFSKNLRKSTRRQLKKLSELGEVTFEKSNASSDFQALANEFLDIESSGWKGRDNTALKTNESTHKFYKELVARSATENKARFLVMRVKGQAISILSDLQSGNAVYSFKTAFDENYREFSPGIQAEIENINNLFEDGIEFADSCTATDASAINRIWAEKEKFQNLVVALKPGMPSWLTRWMPGLQKLIQKFRRK